AVAFALGLVLAAVFLALAGLLGFLPAALTGLFVLPAVTAFAGTGAAGLVATPGLAAGCSGFCMTGAGGAAATAAAFPFTLPGLPLAAPGGAAAAAAAFAPRPRLVGGGGGGGGGGVASGFRYFSVSVRERSLPSSSSMNTSFAIFAYVGISGVICSSVISGNGIFCFTCRHLVKKFLIFCATDCCRAVIAKNKIISGRADDSNCHVRDGVAASFPIKRLASECAFASRSFHASTRSLRGIARRKSEISLSPSRSVRKCSISGATSGAYPSSLICWRVFANALNPAVSAFAVLQRGLRTFSHPSFS